MKAAESPILSLIALLPARYELIVVVTPALNLTQEGIYSKLLAVSIYPLLLSAHFSKRDFRISYLSAIQRRRPVGASPAFPALTPSQLEDYEKYGYKCRDRLHIPGEFPMRRQNLVILNGNKIKLGDSLFTLLMRFVVELKKGKGGWVAPSELVEGGFINDIEHRQRYSQLREHFKGILREKDGEKFIENDRSKGYRFSTHPDFVTYNTKKLKAHPNHLISKFFIDEIG